MTTAAVFDRFGPPDVLYFAEMPDSEPGPGEVRVRVAAAGVQPFDVKFRSGAMSAFMPATFPQRLGNEYAGTVEAVGPDVAEFSAGDEVLGSAMLCAYATHVVVPAATVVRKPATLDFPSAAALVAASQTASGALDELSVGAGDTLLVHAAAGSVGTVAVQLARLRGATVIGTASPANHDYLRSLGAIPVAYGDGLPARVASAAAGPVTVALDAIGGDAIAQSTEIVADRHRIGTIVDDRLAAEHGIRVVRAGRSPERLSQVVALAARGELVLPPRAYAWKDVVEAHRDQETGHGRGKIVLVME
ncbi:NADP-dependent oxidoreductase [Hamadaea tsunoensis]|uniref:NADP-dependent oxidoreductase n=1 Tax=Hamadaea tsunoensis TaxID=53368 RepID=UPI0004249D98|nr:NADP-dependent oxidoreductase [Hamadaea tsunoensis]